MRDDLTAVLIAVLVRTPEWVRHDLDSNEPGERQRAEEALAAMIAAALRVDTSGNA